MAGSHTTKFAAVHAIGFSAAVFALYHLLPPQMISTFVLGLLLGYLSLYTIHKRLAQKLGSIVAWISSLGMLALCSFGIYLGRFERWNSWDVFLDPVSLLRDVWQVVRHPLGNWEVYAVSGLLCAFPS